MTDTEIQKCDEWLRARSKNWQTHRRGNWQYKWKGNTLVRYLDNVSMRELQDGLVLQYLCSDSCLATLSLYSQDIDQSWKPVNAWYETQPMRPPNTGVAQVRLYHALRASTDDSSGDGPYSVENGCMYKVSFLFFWKQTNIVDITATDSQYKSSSGVNYRITNLSRDDEDGTFSYTLERRKRVEQTIDEYTAEKDAFKTRKHKEVLGKNGATSAGGDAASVDATNGKLVTRTVRKNEDCTHDVINETITEEAVTGSVIETRQTLRGKTVTRTDRSQVSKSEPTSMNVGDVVRNEMTETGRWNVVTTTHTAPTDSETIREGCTKTIYRHEHSETKVSPTDPNLTHVTDVSGTALGVIVEKTVTRNDENTYDVTETTKTDIGVTDAEVSVRSTLSGVVKSVTNRNQTSAASTSDLPVGKRVTNRKTDSGRYDVTIESVEEADVGETASDCTKTALEHRHTTTEVVYTEPTDKEATAVANGVIHEKSVRVTDSGAYQVTEQTRTAVAASVKSVSKTKHRTVETTVSQNSAGPEEGSAVEQSGMDTNVDVEVSARRNEFGLVDKTVTKVTHIKREATATYGGPLVTEVLTETSHDTDAPDTTFTAEDGKTMSVSVSQNESGSYEKRVVERTAVKKSWSVTVDTEMAYSYTVYFRNHTVSEMQTLIENEANGSFKSVVDAKMKAWNTANRTPQSHKIYPSMSMNEFGLLDGNVTFSAEWSAGTAGQTGDINKQFYSYAYSAAGEGTSKAGVQVAGRGWNELVKVAEGRSWSGKGASLNSSLSYNPETQMWSYSDSICSYQSKSSS